MAPVNAKDLALVVPPVVDLDLVADTPPTTMTPTTMTEDAVHINRLNQMYMVIIEKYVPNPPVLVPCRAVVPLEVLEMVNSSPGLTV